MISRFFIDRPIFASVLSIVIVLAGLVAMRALPISQYPQIVPPDVVVTASYPGATAETIASTVAAPLEQQINGVERMIYMRSTSTGSGTMSLTVSFEIGTDPDQNAINVNNRVQRALPLLPAEVSRQGVVVQKRSSSILMVMAMSSPDRRYDTVFISNYALLNVIDELRRLPGVGDAALFGSSDYSMRLWLRPDKLAQYNLTPGEVAAVVREQNSQFAAGRFGEEPMKNPQAFTYSVTTPPRLVDPTQFENIIIRSDEIGGALRLKDVARVELGALTYGFSAIFNGAPAVPIGVYLQPGANALEVARSVNETMQRISKRFPDGLRYDVPFNTTRFVEVSIEEVVITFIEAIVLVVLVVFLFLQSARAMIIPVIAIPVSIIGTFAGMYLLGFSINLLTLFGLVLAIGIVVDDAIVVLENVERIMTTQGKSPRDAAIQAMQEVTGPVIAIVLVLCAVFIPVSFLGGLAGELYRQFAVTIAVSVVISGIVALTLTPALAALILKPGHEKPWWPFAKFNKGFDWVTERYAGGVSYLLKRTVVGLAGFGVIIAATVFLFQRVPGGLVPNEDQGYVFLVTALPPAASLSRTREVTAKATEELGKNPAVANVVTFSGFDLLSGAQKTNSGVSFVTLKDWSERKEPAQDARNLAPSFAALNAHFRDGVVIGIQSAADPGPEHDRRLRILPAGSLRRLAGQPRGGGQQGRAGRRQAPRTHGRLAPPSRPACRSTGSTSTATRRRPSASRSTRSSTRCRVVRQPLRQRFHVVWPHLSRQPVLGARFPREAGRSAPGLREVRQERDGAAQRAGDGDADRRPRHGRSLQHLPLRQDPGQSGTGLFVGPGDRCHAAGRGRDPARRLRRSAGPARPIRSWRARARAASASCSASSWCS